MAGERIVAATLAKLARERPDLVADPIAMVDKGFSSIVIRTGSGFVVRIARTAEAGERHAREYRLLSVLPDHLDVAVPAPIWRAEPTPDIPYGAMVYPWIDGKPLNRETDDPRMAAQLAGRLAQIHGLVPSTLRGAPMSVERWRGQTLNTIERSIAQLRADLTPAEYERLRSWQPRIIAHVREIAPTRCVVVHGDFWHDNLLVRGSRLAGIVDWEGCALADPAVDLAATWYVNPRLAAGVLRSYQERTPADPSLEVRTRSFRIVRELGGITWSLRNADPEEYADSLAKVREVLPLLA